MKNLALAFIVFLFVVVVSPACAQQPSFHLPENGNGLLEWCSHLADSPSDVPSSPAETLEAGWCMGHLQTTSEMIGFWEAQVVGLRVVASGKTNPSPEELHEMVAKSPATTCFPKGVKISELARVLVKWLRDHPGRLHESVSDLSMDAFYSTFPCVADTGTKKPASK